VAWKNLVADIEEEFADADLLVDRQRYGRGSVYEGLRETRESYKQAYRARQRERGLCRCCPRPLVKDRRVCAVHLQKDLERQRAWRRRQKESRSSAE
jgi:hypothetical protein